ncbi:MAG: TVP38/TMEM64 family protein [Thermodesulfobacteriota bacterium]
MHNLKDKQTSETGLPQEPQAISWWKNKTATWIIVLLAILALGLLFWGFQHRSFLWGQLCDFIGVCPDKEWVKATVKAAGPLAPFVFILIQSFQVVFAPIPGEATGFIGGFLFGVPLGLLYSTLGLTIGSAMAFLIARWLEEHYIKRWIPVEILQKFDFLMERQGALVSFILFLLPGFPKDYLCFVLGLSRMPFKLFLLICTIGRIPGTLLLNLQGAKVYKGDYYSTFIILGLCLVLIGVLAYYREAVYRWIRRFDHPDQAVPDSDQK